MAETYMVVTGKSVITRQQEHLLGGAVVPEEAFTEEGIANLVRAGFLRKATDPDPEPDTHPMLRPDSNLKLGPSREWVEPKVGDSPPPPINYDEPPVTETKPQVDTPWSLDPRMLEGKTIEQLNVMILERDPHAFGDEGPYETVEEAVAHLTRDVSGPKA